MKETSMTDKKDGEVQGWIATFRTSCDRGGIAVSKDNEIFRLAEKFFWLGLVTGVGQTAIPLEITNILIQNQSPLLEYKPKRTRAPRTKKDKGEPVV